MKISRPAVAVLTAALALSLTACGSTVESNSAKFFDLAAKGDQAGAVKFVAPRMATFDLGGLRGSYYVNEKCKRSDKFTTTDGTGDIAKKVKFDVQCGDKPLTFTYNFTKDNLIEFIEYDQNW